MTLIIDIYTYADHNGAILLDDQKRLILEPNGEGNRIMLENILISAQRRIPGNPSNVQLLTKLPDYFQGVVHAELRSEGA